VAFFKAPKDANRLNSYTYAVKCADCRAEWFVGHCLISLPLSFTDGARYVCRRCFLAVVLPRRVEARFLQQLAEDQTDEFGNPSPFRSQLAREVKRFGRSGRPYGLVAIPEISILCPQDGAALEPWNEYPENPPLLCPKCGSRSGAATATGEIGHGVLATW